MKYLVSVSLRFFDAAFWFFGWLNSRRDTIERLELRIARLIEQNAREREEWAGREAILNRHIEILASLHQRQVALIESETAIHARRQSDAANSPTPPQ